MTKSTEQGFLVEFRQVGNVIKVSAVDPDSGVEVSIMGPATSPQSELTRGAINKLKYMLAKQQDR